MKNDQFQAKSKICYDKMGDSYRSFAEITRDAIKEASILKAADRPTQQRFEHHISPGIFMAHGFPNPDVLQACMEYDFNLAPLGSRGGEIEEIRNQVAPNTQLWLIGHSHRQSAWWFDGQTWNELSPGFGTDLEGHTRSIVPNNNTPTVLMQTEIDFQQYPISSLLILNPGSVGFPRDGIVLKDFGVNLAKYLILELNDSKLKVTFCAVPYMFAKESSDVWRAWYPAEVFNMLAIGQDDLSREEIPV